MQKERLTYLFEQYSRNTATPEEVQELSHLIRENNSYELFSSTLISLMEKYPASVAELTFTSHLAEKILQIDKSSTTDLKSAARDLSTSSAHRIPIIRTAWFRYAAALLLIAGAATFLYLNHQGTQQTVNKQSLPDQDVAPGGNHAILTLSDGRTMTLDSMAVGDLARQGNARVMKLTNGSLAYIAESGTDSKIVNNTVTTPKGAHSRIVLPDGTEVWLNAASSITFPTAFVRERRIMITGEAYFEVVKDKTRAFTVSANGTDVEVLGTSFNVNAYTDESSVKTSLVEGSVKVLKEGKSVILKPGQQCTVVSGQPLVASNADIEQTLAWKNGMFHFNKTDLADAMRQLSRWYDVEVVYEKGVPNILLGGEMKRDLTLSQLLEALGELGLNFRINKKQLTVINDSPVK